MAVSPAQHLGQLARLDAARELEEQLLQARVPRLVLPPQIRDRAARYDAAVLHDGDLIAHRLGDFQRVRAHQHGPAFADELAEDVLEQAGGPWGGAHPRLRPHPGTPAGGAWG